MVLPLLGPGCDYYHILFVWVGTPVVIFVAGSDI